MIYVTHDQIEALTLADRIAVMKDSVIQQLGTPQEIYLRPANRFVATFVGSPAMNFVPGRIEGAGAPVFRSASLRLPLPATSSRTRRPMGRRWNSASGRSISVLAPDAADAQEVSVEMSRTDGQRSACLDASRRSSAVDPAAGGDDADAGRSLAHPVCRSTGSTCSTPRTARALFRRIGTLMPITDILSIQLYTLRSLNDLDTILDTVAAAGFRNVEGSARIWTTRPT